MIHPPAPQTDLAAGSVGLVPLTEVHDLYSAPHKLSANGSWTYDLVLPGLVLHASEQATSEDWPNTSQTSPTDSS
jgi:hypothetical protein